MDSEAKSSERKIGNEWQEYLTQSENALTEYSIGGYRILTTDKRILLLKKLPKSFIEIKYDELIAIEHSTDILWGDFGKSMAFSAVGAYIYEMYMKKNLTEALSSILAAHLPELQNIIPMNYAIQAAIAALVVTATVNLVNFLFSLVGYLRFSRKNRSPIKIHTPFSTKIRGLIKEVEDEILKTKETAYAAPAERISVEPALIKRPTAQSIEGIYKTLKSELTDMKSDSIVLISVESQQHADAISSIMRILANEKSMSGVYISVSAPYEQIMHAMKSENVKTNKIFFIDCISHMAGKLPAKAENAIFIENPSSLEEVSMYVDKLLGRIPEPKFMLLDSLSSLLIYNSERSVEEFTHLVINKMRIEKVGGVIISIKQKESEALTKTLVPMCDKEITL